MCSTEDRNGERVGLMWLSQRVVDYPVSLLIHCVWGVGVCFRPPLSSTPFIEYPFLLQKSSVRWQSQLTVCRQYLQTCKPAGCVVPFTHWPLLKATCLCPRLGHLTEWTFKSAAWKNDMMEKLETEAGPTPSSL